MSEENKQCCECKEKALKVLKEVLVIAVGVFIGTFLAVLLSANVLRPKHYPPHRGFYGHHPRLERQLPPPPVHHYRMQPERFRRGDFPDDSRNLKGKNFNPENSGQERKRFNRTDTLPIRNQK